MITATFHLHTTGRTAAWIKDIEVHRTSDKNRNLKLFFFSEKTHSSKRRENIVAKYSSQNIFCNLPLHPVKTFINLFSHFVTGMQMLQGILYQGSASSDEQSYYGMICKKFSCIPCFPYESRKFMKSNQYQQSFLSSVEQHSLSPYKRI